MFRILSIAVFALATLVGCARAVDTIRHDVPGPTVIVTETVETHSHETVVETEIVIVSEEVETLLGTGACTVPGGCLTFNLEGSDDPPDWVGPDRIFVGWSHVYETLDNETRSLYMSEAAARFVLSADGDLAFRAGCENNSSGIPVCLGAFNLACYIRSPHGETLTHPFAPNVDGYAEVEFLRTPEALGWLAMTANPLRLPLTCEGSVPAGIKWSVQLAVNNNGGRTNVEFGTFTVWGQDTTATMNLVSRDYNGNPATPNFYVEDGVTYAWGSP